MEGAVASRAPETADEEAGRLPEIDRSVARIVNYRQEPDWYSPWDLLPVREAWGSGFVIAGGWIMTNAHVVSDARMLLFYLHGDPTPHEAQVLAVGHDCDLALLEPLEEGLLADHPSLPFGELPRLRSVVETYGYPAGGSQISSTRGVVSRIEMQYYTHPWNERHLAVQTDAAINPGNSGGPLLNLRGEVVGVNAAIASASGGFEGIGFAIPSNMAIHISRELIARGKVERGWLGVSVQDLTHDLSRTMGLEATRGALVSEVHKASPAEKAGLRQGDVVIAYNGREIRDASQLRNEAASSPIGGEVRLTILREGQKREVPVRIESMESRTLAATPSIQERLGITVRGATAREASRLKLKPGQGVIITRVEPAGPGAKAGLEPGDAILEVNEIPLSSAQDLSGALALVKPGEQILATIMDGRTRQRGSLQIRLR